MGIVQLMDGVEDELYSEKSYEQALYILQLSESIDFAEGILYAKQHIGFYYQEIEELEKAIFVFHELRELSEAVQDRYYLSSAYLGLGNVYESMDEYEIAISYFQKQLDLGEKISDPETISTAWLGFGNIYAAQERYQAALDAYEIAKSWIEKLPEEDVFARSNKNVILSNIADIYIDMNRSEEALIASKEVLQSVKDTKDSFSLSQTYSNLGDAYAELKVFNKAFAYYDTSLYYANYFKQQESEYFTYLRISNAYALKGDTETALKYYEQYHDLESDFIGRETRRQITELEFKYETAEQEKALLESQKNLAELKMSRQRMWLLIGLLIFGLLLGILSYLKLKDDARRKQALQAVETALVESELKNKELEAQKLQKDLANKQSDLTNLALDIARKNEFSNQLALRLDGMQKNAPASISPALRELSLFASSHLRISEDLSQFQSNVEDINQRFYQTLDTKFEGLSSKDKYLCGLIRLNLSNKDVAAIRGISTNSAKVNRYRLRKKLGLDPDVDIVDFLQQL